MQTSSNGVREEVFDVPTLKALYYLSNHDIIEALGGVISTGKEANVFHALGPSQTELAVKIYRIQTSDFKAMQDDIIGDPRFQSIRRTKKDIVFAWSFYRHGSQNISHHPNAEEFLQRDLKNIVNFFSENGVCASFDKTLKEIKDEREHKGPA